VAGVDTTVVAGVAPICANVRGESATIDPRVEVTRGVAIRPTVRPRGVEIASVAEPSIVDGEGIARSIELAPRVSGRRGVRNLGRGVASDEQQRD
jgi:hypothetical protein